MASPILRIAVVALGCAAVLGLQGCAGVKSAIIGRAMDQWMPGQPVVNAYHFSRLPVGTWVAVSTWRVLGPDPSQAEVVLDGLGSLLPFKIKVATQATASALVLQRLHQQDDGCESPIRQLEAAFDRVGDVLELWPRSGSGPWVRLIVVPPLLGAAGVRLSTAETAESLELRVATQLPESTACIWTRHWVTETVDTVLHELAHLKSFVTRGQAMDLLREEFLAYSIGECVHRAIEGLDVARNRTFPGLQELSVQEVFAAVDQRRLPPTIAARFLAHRYWAGTRSLGPAVDWRTACRRLEADYPDPRRLFSES